MRNDRIKRLRPSRCLDCGALTDAAMHANAAKGRRIPKPNDVTICIECGHLMAFADDLTLRPLTDAEMIAVAGDRDIVMAQRLIAETKRKRRGG